MYFFGDVTRSSPVLYHEYCIQDGNLFPKFFSLALNSALTCLYDACSVTNIPRGALGTIVNPDTCGRENSILKSIRVDVEMFESGNK